MIDNKDNFIATAQGVAEWLTSDSMKSFYSDVGQMVQDIGQIMTDLGTILDDSGILPGLWEGFIVIIEGVRDIIHEIAEDIAKIKSGGLGSWLMGNYNSYTWDSGGFGSGGFASGGMMAGNVTVNNNFSINSNSLITESTVRSWADIITEQVNENLGRMV